MTDNQIDAMIDRQIERHEVFLEEQAYDAYLDSLTDTHFEDEWQTIQTMENS